MNQEELKKVRIIKDNYFIQFVKEEMQTLRNQRNSRSVCKPGFKYKRDWYDRMTDENIFTSDYFISQIEAIWQRKSNLGSVYRNIILHVCNEAYTRMMIKYQEEDTNLKSESNE